MYIVNTSTSIVPVPSKQLFANQSTIVYVSSTTDAGQLVTIVNIDGFLSSPQRIIVSTTLGITFETPGISSIVLQQGFSYLTLRSESSTKWSMVNQNAFPLANIPYTTHGLQFTTLNALEATTSSVTTSSVQMLIQTVQSSLTTVAPLFTSSIIINLGTNYPYFQTESASNTGNYAVQSTFSTTGATAFYTNLQGNDSISVQNDMTVAGGYIGVSPILIQNSFSTNQRVLVNSNLTVNGPVTTGSNVTCFSGVLTSSVNTNTAQTTTLFSNEVRFPYATLLTNGGLQVVSSIQNSNTFIQTSSFYTRELSTNTITVLSTIYAPSVPNLSFQSGALSNANGSLVVSSVVTQTLELSTLYGSNYTRTVPIVSANSALFSTMFVNNTVRISDSLSTAITNTDVCVAENLTGNILDLGGDFPLAMNAFSISSMNVTQGVVAGQMSSFTMYSTVINATGAVVNTSNVGAGPVTASTIQLAQGIYATNALIISTPSVSFPRATIQAVSSQTITTSSIFSMGASVGAPIDYTVGAPYMYGSTVSGLSADTVSEFITGQGTPYFPFRVLATSDRTVNAFTENPSGAPSTYMNISYIYRTDTATFPGSASVVVGNPIVQSTILTLSSGSANSYQNYNLSNYVIDPKVVSSIVQYYLTGPETYSAPGVAQTLLAGGSGGSGMLYKLAYSSDGGNSWTVLPFVAFETACIGIAWGADKWVAVGQGSNTIAFSYTGTVWYFLGTATFSSGGMAIAYGSGLWVALGAGTNSIAYSYDGIAWTGIGTAVFTMGNGVATNGTIWVGVGQAGTNTIARSTDGIVWTGQGSTVFSVAGNGVAWGNRWVAVGHGVNTLATSPDGIVWSGQTVFSDTGRCVAWNGTSWLAGGTGTFSIATSANGLAWTAVTTCPLTTVNSITWGGTQWVATGSGPTSSIAVSPDGINWTVSADLTFFTLGLAVANRVVPAFVVPPAQTFLATGQGATQLASSPDGTNWTPRATPFTTSTTCVAYNGTLWVAGGSGTYALAYSTNGIAWTGVSFANLTTVYAVAYGPTGWIAVGQGSAGYTRAESVNGTSWTQIATGSFFSGTAYGIAWSQDVWVATGTPEDSGILFSVDGSTWVPQINTIFTTGRCVASNGTYFLAGGSGSTALAYSVEGSVWSAVGGAVFTQVNGVAWGSRLWVAVGQGANTLAYSYDGVNWYGLGTSIFSVAGSGVTWNGSAWVATGQGVNTLATSPDGITWTGQGTSVFSVAGGGISVSKSLPNTVVNRDEPVGIRWSFSGVVQISPTVIQKPPRSASGWNARASSLDGYVPTAFLQFKPYSPDVFCMVGLTENPTVSVGYTALNYAFCLTSGGAVQIFELGVQVAYMGSYQVLDIFQILFDGSAVNYIQNGATVRTVARPVGNALYLGSSFNNAGTRLVDVEFHPQYLLNPVAPVVPYTYTTINPSGFTGDPLVFKRTVTESVLLPSLWEVKIPISGTLSNISSQLYGELYVGASRIFSTATLQNAFLPTVSTYTLSYLNTSNIAVTPGDTMQFLIHTQRGLGTTAIFSTTLSESIYNLSSVQYVQLIHTSAGVGQQTSDFSVSLANISTPYANYVTSNTGIEMNTGYMVWKSRQYGLAIQNEYNDLQTRTITYTGGLYTASDSNLKYDIEYADSSELYQALRRIPLNRYAMSDIFLRTFRTRDAHQLGVLTTNVAKEFPGMIHKVDSEHLGIPDLETVDRVQFRYAHLGATQHLMERVSSLSGKIRTLCRI